MAEVSTLPSPTTWQRRLIPVTRTAADFPEALPGMPFGKAAQVLVATPEGYRVSTKGRSWLRQRLRTEEYKSARKDQQRGILAVAEFLAVCRQFEHGILRPGLPVLLEASGLSERTLYRVLRWLREHRWIGHVQRGSTERYRGGRDQEGNLAAEFVLLVGSSKNGSPSRFLSFRDRNKSLSRTRETNNKKAPLRGTDHSSKPSVDGNNQQPPEKEKQAWPRSQAPRTGQERLKAASALRDALPDLRTLSSKAIRSLLGPFYKSGWTNADVQYSLDHKPDGQAWDLGGGSHGVRHTEGWISYRLRPWTTNTETGTQPAASRTERRQEAARIERETARAAREKLAAETAAEPASAETRQAALKYLADFLAAKSSRRPSVEPNLPAKPPRGWRR